MEVYDRDGNPLEEYDLERGYLVDSTRTVHHDAVEGVEEVGHEVVLRRYPNGGNDVKWVVDVPGVQAREAWDEEIPIRVYVPYADEELDAMERERNRPTPEQRLDEVDTALVELASMMSDMMMGMAELAALMTGGK